MIQTVEGIVLRSQNLSESDQRLTLYTKELGKVRVKLVGVRKNSAKLKGLTIPFIESRFQIYLHGNRRTGFREPGRMIGGEAVHFHSSLREDWDQMMQCLIFSETLDLLTYPLYPNLKEYQLCALTLNQMESGFTPILVRLRSTLILLKILGYSLRNHSTWKSYLEEEKMLLNRLGKWRGEKENFLNDEIEKLEKITNSYLSLYLPHPLKTELFQWKLFQSQSSSCV